MTSRHKTVQRRLARVTMQTRKLFLNVIMKTDKKKEKKGKRPFSEGNGARELSQQELETQQEGIRKEKIRKQ